MIPARAAGRLAGVAQLVERQLPKLNVAGSSPVSRFRSAAAVGSAERRSFATREQRPAAATALARRTVRYLPSLGPSPVSRFRSAAAVGSAERRSFATREQPHRPVIVGNTTLPFFPVSAVIRGMRWRSLVSHQ